MPTTILKNLGFIFQNGQPVIIACSILSLTRYQCINFPFCLLCISSTTNSESWDYIKLYHCLCPSAWNCADIAQRNYSLIASGSERVKKRWKIQCCDLHSQSDTKIFQWVREWNLGAEPSLVFLHSCSNHHIGIIIPARSTTIQNSSSSRRWSLYLQHRGWILGQHHCR